MISTDVIKAMEKAWGTNFPVFHNANFELHHAFIEPGGYSSCHCHQNKYNLFYTVKGELYIHFYRAEPTLSNISDIAHTVILEVGERLIVPPKVWHRFYAPENGSGVDLIEAYWNSDVNQDDIVRKDIGGIYPV